MDQTTVDELRKQMADLILNTAARVTALRLFVAALPGAKSVKVEGITAALASVLLEGSSDFATQIVNELAAIRNAVQVMSDLRS